MTLLRKDTFRLFQVYIHTDVPPDRFFLHQGKVLYYRNRLPYIQIHTEVRVHQSHVIHHIHTLLHYHLHQGMHKVYNHFRFLQLLFEPFLLYYYQQMSEKLCHYVLNYGHHQLLFFVKSLIIFFFIFFLLTHNLNVSILLLYLHIQRKHPSFIVVLSLLVFNLILHFLLFLKFSADFFCV